MSQWRKEVAPWAEKIAHLFGQAVKGKYQPATPLTKKNQIVAQGEVKKRKSQEEIYRDVFIRDETSSKQRVKKENRVIRRNCATCGGPLSRGQHVNCPACWESLPGQDLLTRKQRGSAISEKKRENSRWREGHPEKMNPEEFREKILPGLQGVPLSKIMETCDVAKSTASAIRSGKRVPAERFWEPLKSLGDSR